MSQIEQALQQAAEARTQYVQALTDLTAIPSVSAQAAHKADMEKAAAFVADFMRTEIGLSRVEIMPTGGHPVVYGEWLGAAGKPTVLIYGHYDVQPAVVADGWQSEPFAPTVRGDNLYGRGASDMKGQVMATLSALASLAKTGGLPVNVKLMIEGEEEIGSPNLTTFMAENRELLKGDFSLNPDVGMISPSQPAIIYALRGLAYFEVRVQGPATDLHSGVFGGAVHNPAQVLVEVLAGMKDSDGRVTLPGFYDRVRPLTDEERALLAALPLDDETIRDFAGNPPGLFGEVGYTASERATARPSLDINGLYSGYIDEGSKTVLPAKAMAKFSFRLVADQKPEEVAAQVRAYFEAAMPKTVTWELIEHSHCPAAMTNRESVWVKAAAQALHESFGVAPLFRREGGTIPVVGYIEDMLGMESVLMGFALPDDGMHGPNEKLHLPNYYRGIDTMIRFFGALGR